MATKPKSASSLDTNKDGKISAKEAAAGGDSSNDLLAGLGVPPPAADASKGQPLYPYSISDQDVLAGVKVKNQSGKHKGSQIGARYYEADTLGPLHWSPEERARLQKTMYDIGLYGKNPVTLGNWGADDQAALAELLAEANVTGRNWSDQLQFWKIHPPADILAKIKGNEPKLPTIQVTNPIDIQQAAQSVSQDVLGRVDRSAVSSAVPDYQTAEKQSQQAAIADQQAGGGGVVAQPPSLQGFLADRMRREHPIEADGYSFVNKFNTFAQLVGAQHMGTQ